MKTNAKQVSNEIQMLTKAIRKDGVKQTNLAAQRVKKGIRDSILNSKKIDGRSRGKIRASTAKTKRKSGSSTPTIALRDKGVMLNVNITTATLDNPKSVLTPPKSRLATKKGFNVASHHQDGRLGPWFGVSQEAQKATDRLTLEIAKTALARFNK